MHPKYILFDADGVIIHSELFSHQYAKAFDIKSEDMLPFFLGDFSPCLVWKANLKEILPHRLPKRNWKWSVDEFLDYWFSSENHPDHNLLAYIQQFRSQWFICCVATNQEYWRVEYMKTTMRFSELFDFVFSSAQLWIKKPNQEFFQRIHHLLEEQYTATILPEDIMFFDDTQENVEQAKELGINAYIYQWIDQVTSILSTYVE